MKLSCFFISRGTFFRYIFNAEFLSILSSACPISETIFKVQLMKTISTPKATTYRQTYHLQHTYFVCSDAVHVCMYQCTNCSRYRNTWILIKPKKLREKEDTKKICINFLHSNSWNCRKNQKHDKKEFTWIDFHKFRLYTKITNNTDYVYE